MYRSFPDNPGSFFFKKVLEYEKPAEESEDNYREDNGRSQEPLEG
jgi:hypothetical protein